jgi:hypothetical protein
VTPQVAVWLRPRASLSGTFSFNRDPNARDPVRDLADTAGPFHVPVAFSNGRHADLGMQFDAHRFGQRIFGDSAAVTKLLGHVTNVDVSYGRSQTSSYNRTGFLPSLTYQLALAYFDNFKSQGGLLASSAADNWNLNAAGNLLLILGLRVSANYRETNGLTWILRTDQQVPLRTGTREWPSGSVSWTVSPARTVLGRLLTSLSAQLTYHEQRSTSEQLGFTTVAATTALTETVDRFVRPTLSVTWRQGISTSFDATRIRSDQVNAGNVFRTERNQTSGNLGFAFRPPAKLIRLKNAIRATVHYTASTNTTCLQTPGQAVCVPYVDSRQTQSQLTLDTDLPRTLSAGFQMAYLVNDERQINRKTSQLVITAFVEFHSSVGQIQ